MSQNPDDWRNVEDTTYEGVLEQMKSSAGFLRTFATTLNVKGQYVGWENIGINAESTLSEKVVRVLDLWLQHEDGAKKDKRVLLEHLKRNQRAKSCKPLIDLLEQDDIAITHNQPRMQAQPNDLGPASQGIDEELWDDFLALVHSLLEDHPIAQADTVMALQLGSSVHHHYDTWKVQDTNIAKPFRFKVEYLLNYWKRKKNHSSMRAMVIDLDQKLKTEASFNMMREQIKKRFL